MKIFKISIISIILIYALNCKKSTEPILPIEPDDYNLDTCQIISTFHANHSFHIIWEQSKDELFHNYQLYMAQESNMLNGTIVYQTDKLDDTTVTISNIEYKSIFYFQLHTIYHNEIRKLSDVIKGSSYPVILFERHAFNIREIYLLNSEDSVEIQLTNNTDYDGWPRFSPDGSKFVFETNRDGNHELYEFDLKNKHTKNLSNNLSADIDPTFTPDGSKIIFISNRDGYYEVYAMNADGSNQTQLTFLQRQLRTPMVSPDGSEIAVVKQRKLYKLNIDGSNIRLYAVSPFHGHFFIPRFSPDGSEIAVFLVDVTCTYTWLFIFKENGEIIEYPNSFSPLYHPTQPYLYYNYNSLGIFREDRNTGERLQLTSDWEDWASDISSDGMKILFNSDIDGDWEVYSMYYDGSNQKKLTENMVTDQWPQIQPFP